MKSFFKKTAAFTLCLLLLCAAFSVNAEQTVTVVKHYTMPSYFAPIQTEDVLAGDINGDKSADNKDLLRLFKYLSGWDVDYVEAALDVNGDGNVNNKDFTRLFKALTDWDNVQIFPVCSHTGGKATCCSRAICEKCGRRYGDLDPDNHSGGTEIRGANPPTCANSGYTGDTYCVGCGAEIAEGSSIPPTGLHLNTAVRGKIDATCIAAGYTGDTYCVDCGRILNTGSSVPPTGTHRLSDWQSDAEKHWKSCNDCGAIFDQSPHSGGSATCSKKAICEVCGAEYGEINASAHNYVSVVVNPTCTERGYTKHTCSGCNSAYIDSYVPPLNHTGGVATCCSKAKCERCGAEYGEFDSNNHRGETAIEGAVPPTGSSDGYTGDVVCLGCGQIISYGHSYAQHTCTGGTATYAQRAICEICGEEYGNYAQMLAYDQLNETQKNVYGVLNTAILNLDKSDIYLEDYVDDPDTAESDINLAFRALSYDKPDYFWMPRNYSLAKSINSRTGKLLHIYVTFAGDQANGEYHVSAAEKAKMQTALEQQVTKIVKVAKTYNSFFDMEVYVHDYLCKNVTYDYDAANAAPGTADYRAFTAYGALVKGTCVCEGYSRAMQLICQRLGIPCGLATGVYYTENKDAPGTYFATLHMWNIINPSGGCYYLDVTFDDLDFDTSPYFPLWHVYFNLSYEEMAIDHVFDDLFTQGADYSDMNSEFNFFDCFGNRYNLGYYTNSHAYILKGDASGAAEYLVAAKARGQTYADVFFDANSMSAKEAMKLLNQALAGKMNIITEYVYIDSYFYLKLPG